MGEGQKLHVDQWEVLSFLGLVPEVFFLPSKRCLAIVLASLSDGVDSLLMLVHQDQIKM